MFIAGEDTNFVQLGIKSFENGQFPDVYTRITEYKQWIKKTLHNSKDEKPVSECSKRCEWPALNDILSGSTEAITKYKECYEKNQYQITVDNVITGQES